MRHKTSDKTEKTDNKKIKPLLSQRRRKSIAPRQENGGRSEEIPVHRYELYGLAELAVALISIGGLLDVNVGFVGIYFAKVLRYFFGYAVWPAVLSLVGSGLYTIRNHQHPGFNRRTAGLALLFAALPAIFHHFAIPVQAEILPESLVSGGGLLGGSVLFVCRKFLGLYGTLIVLILLAVAGVVLATGWSLANGMKRTEKTAKRGVEVAQETIRQRRTPPVQPVVVPGENVAGKFYNQENDARFTDGETTAVSPVTEVKPEPDDTPVMPVATVLPLEQSGDIAENTHGLTFSKSDEFNGNGTTAVERLKAKEAAFSIDRPFTLMSYGQKAVAEPTERDHAETAADNLNGDNEIAVAVKSIVDNDNGDDNTDNGEIISSGSVASDNGGENIVEPEKENSVEPEDTKLDPVAVMDAVLEPPAPEKPAGRSGEERPSELNAAIQRAMQITDDVIGEENNVEDEPIVETPSGAVNVVSTEEISDVHLETAIEAEKKPIELSPEENNEAVLAADDKLTEITEASEEATDIAVVPQNDGTTDKIDEPEPTVQSAYVMPDVRKLLKKRAQRPLAELEQEINAKAAILSTTLENFKVSAKIINACHGPAVTRYEVEPAPGVKVSKITNLADDLALALAAFSVRIEPIAGKAAIGIEVPNSELEGVSLRDVLEDPQFAAADSKLTCGIGMDISGEAIFADIAEMPHLLVAGSTGSGKSVCINTLITSILFKAAPDEVKFILIDPKMVELSNYNGIPHLMVPVVTDAKKAASVLNWAVQEMEKRYEKFAASRVRKMESYNKVAAAEGWDLMPSVVIIIDELADLMMVAAHDVEDAICRLAQKARAAGIHLVLATQRPSVDVLTGIIKANIPSRISFAVSSQIDSRTILDMGGAEKLLGKGDMLFAPAGRPKPLRVQGAFVSDEEVENLLAFIRNQGYATEVNQEIISFTEQDEADEDAADNDDGGNDYRDEYLERAVQFVISQGQASTSSIQRRLRIGYTRAGRLIDMMEALGIIGPANGSKPRELLMTEIQALETVRQHN